ncbi:MAG TPA: hypothetical protein VMT67_01010 [Terriglobales bacterium]|nr:hypothetical protein [Terriglobales bacterium]
MSATYDAEAAEDTRQMNMILASFQRDGIATKTDAEKVSYLSAGLLVSYQLIRSVAGDEWVRGWLEAALHDVTNNPCAVEIRKPS